MLNAQPIFNADSPHPEENLEPQSFGWKGCYVLEWFSGPPMPEDLFQEDNEREDYVDDYK